MVIRREEVRELELRLRRTEAMSRLLLLFSYVAVAAAQGPAKSPLPPQHSRAEVVDHKVRRLVLEGTQSLPVFIVLRQQPQRDALEHLEGPAGLRLKILEGRYAELAGRSVVAETELSAARNEMEKAALEVRQAVFAEIEARVRPDQEVVAQQVAQLGGRVVRRYTAINMIAARLPASGVDVLATHPFVAEISLIEEHSAQLVTSAYSLGADVFWSGGYTGAGESVAVMDTGVRTGHPAFRGLNIVSKAFLEDAKENNCFDDDAGSAEDKQGHGTHVAGIVASRGASGWSEYQGVAKGLGSLYNLKIGYRTCKGGGSGTTSDVISALEWAVKQAPWLKVFNYSFGGLALDDDDFSTRAFDYFADTYGLTIAVAAGNESGSFLVWTRPGPVSSPGIGYNVISVAAMNTQGTAARSDDKVAIFSSQGPTADGRKKPDVAAPGGLKDRWDALRLGWVPEGGIYSADYASDGFVAMAGTSMASPHIAGSAALLRQSGVREPLALKALLLNTTGNTGWDTDVGWGYADLSSASNKRANVVTSSISAGGTQLYKGSSDGAFFSTLTWNRAVDVEWKKGCLSNLDLALYDSAGKQISSSRSKIDNVEKVYAKTAETLTVSVTSNQEGFCRSSESFALAFSKTGFEAAGGPLLSASCAVPATVVAADKFSATCTVINRGDLPALSVKGTLQFASGSTISTQDFGTISQGSSSSRTWTVTAPSSAGAFTLQLAVWSDSFGGRYTGSETTTISATSGGCTAGVSPASASFSAAGGSENISVSAAAGCPWQAVSGDSWITVTAGAQGSGNGTVAIKVSSHTASTSRTGSTTIAGQTVTVFQAGISPEPEVAAALNAASYQDGIAATEWISVFGKNLSTSTRSWRDDEIVDGVLPTELDGVRVTVNGKPAAIAYISPTQINVQSPSDEATGPVQIKVTRDQQTSATTARMQPFAPGLFLYDADSRRYAAAQHGLDYSTVGKTGLYDDSTPAKPGETVILYGTGFGPTDPATPAGRVVTTPARLANSVRVTIAGVDAEVRWAGMSAAGLCQFNVVVPETLPDGDAAVIMEMGGYSTQKGVYLTVKR